MKKLLATALTGLAFANPLHATELGDTAWLTHAQVRDLYASLGRPDFTDPLVYPAACGGMELRFSPSQSLYRINFSYRSDVSGEMVPAPGGLLLTPYETIVAGGAATSGTAMAGGALVTAGTLGAAVGIEASMTSGLSVTGGTAAYQALSPVAVVGAISTWAGSLGAIGTLHMGPERLSRLVALSTQGEMTDWAQLDEGRQDCMGRVMTAFGALANAFANEETNEAQRASAVEAFRQAILRASAAATPDAPHASTRRSPREDSPADSPSSDSDIPMRSRVGRIE